MAPAKAARSGHDDSKESPAPTKEKNGNTAAHQANGKMRRVASSTGTNLREVTNASATSASAAAAATASAAAATTAQETPAPGLQWPAFERDVLHAYRRAYRLKTPAAFSSEYHRWVLTQPGSIGLYSPTIARSKEFRRQARDQLSGAVRKHFNGLGVQENDVIVDFLHKVRSEGVAKGRIRRADYMMHEIER